MCPIACSHSSNFTTTCSMNNALIKSRSYSGDKWQHCPLKGPQWQYAPFECTFVGPWVATFSEFTMYAYANGISHIAGSFI